MYLVEKTITLIPEKNLNNNVLETAVYTLQVLFTGQTCNIFKLTNSQLSTEVQLHNTLQLLYKSFPCLVIRTHGG